MKTLTIGTKSQADRLLTDSLFKPVNGRTLTAERYDLGKYKPDQSFVGRELQVADDVVALWTEVRKDTNGPYKALFCLTAFQPMPPRALFPCGCEAVGILSTCPYHEPASQPVRTAQEHNASPNGRFHGH